MGGSRRPDHRQTCAPAPGREPGTLRLTAGRCAIHRHAPEYIPAGQELWAATGGHGRTDLDDAWLQPRLRPTRAATEVDLTRRRHPRGPGRVRRSDRRSGCETGPGQGSASRLVLALRRPPLMRRVARREVGCGVPDSACPAAGSGIRGLRGWRRIALAVGGRRVDAATILDLLVVALPVLESAPKASTGVRQRAQPEVSALIAFAAVRRYPSAFPPIGHVAGTSILVSRCSRKGSSIELTPPSGG